MSLLDANLSKLERTDWSFRDAKTGLLTHGVHPYPAKFIPQIPAHLIEALSSKGERVADVFAGSGTTLVEGLIRGRSVVGVDANPLACMIARSKTTPLSDADCQLLDSLAVRAVRSAELVEARPAKWQSAGWRPIGDDVEFWFTPIVVEELAEALHIARSIEDPRLRDVAQTAFSSVVVRVSKQDSDTRYVRREKPLSPGDALRLFGRALRDAVGAGRDLRRVMEPGLDCEVINASVLDAPEMRQADLVVCSPPYPNAYSYHLYHRTRMLWLEMDQPTFKSAEIGSHRKYSRKGSGRATEETFLSEMTQVFGWLSSYLRVGRQACFVVGDSTLNGVRVSNADLISAAASATGFVEAARLTRQLHSGRKSFNPVIGKIREEHIVILTLEGGAAHGSTSAGAA